MCKNIAKQMKEVVNKQSKKECILYLIIIAFMIIGFSLFSVFLVKTLIWERTAQISKATGNIIEQYPYDNIFWISFFLFVVSGVTFCIKSKRKNKRV